MKRLAVIGSRIFDDYEALKIILDEIDKFIGFDIIVSGGANGADNLAEKYAWNHNKEVEIYVAEWEKYGKGAGFIRNKEIWDNADLGVAFWDGKSKGTAHSFDIAKKQHKDLYLYNALDESFILLNN